MKKTLFVLLCAVMTLHVWGQQSNVSFNGMSMNVPLETMVRHITSMGYTLENYTPYTAAYLKGYYHGYPSYLVLGTDKTGNVNDITWELIPRQEWDDMRRLFDLVKNDMVQDFGTPTELVDTSYKKKTNIGKLHALQFDDIELRINYVYPDGSIYMWLGYINGFRLMAFYKTGQQ